jgi:hemerythrin-like domain-containing protein
MRPTEWLVKEHDTILAMIDAVEAVAKNLASGKAVDPEDLKAIVDFIRNFADKCHHAKEEDLLFTALEKVGVPVQGGPIGVMLHEHEIGRSYVANMAGAIDGYREGNEEAGKRYAENARGYAALLRDHINKENTVLYPIADMHLSAEEQERLRREFERIDQESFGADRISGYRKLAEEMRGKYL